MKKRRGTANGAGNVKISRGKWGENLSCSFLERRNFQILERNFFSRIGEIDIIAQKEDVIYFFEVKTRLGKRYGSHESVNFFKKQGLEKTAQIWLGRNNCFNSKVVPVTLVVQVDKILKKAQIFWFSGWGP